MSTRQKYETVVILDEKGIGDDGNGFLDEFVQMLKGEFKGKVVKGVNLGRKQFAREMKKRKTGIYLDVVHELKPELEKVLRERFRLDERVLRLQSYTYDRPEQAGTAED